MYAVIAYFKYNIKMLIKDKISFVWSIILPSVFLLMNQDNVFRADDLRFWWSYIVICSYLYGIGVYALNLKESGSLKTIFSVNNNNFLFFFGNLLTQAAYSFLCIAVFNALAFLVYRFPIMELLFYSCAMILMLIPVSFFSFLITLMKNIHVNTLSTIVNIIIMILFFLLNSDTTYYYLNPLYYFANVIMIRNITGILIYALVSIIMIVAGIYSIKRFTVIPTERR